MAGAVISTIQALLKDVYLPPVVEQLNNADVLLSRIERVTDPMQIGNQLVTPLHTTRTGGIGSRGELAALPTSGNQGFARAVWTLTHHYGRLQVSGVAMAQSKNNVGSFLEVLKAEMDGLKNDLRRDLARQVWGPSDGNTGGNARIAQCGTTTASTTVVLNSAEALRKGHIYPGMVVDIGTAASPTSLASAVTVQSVNVAGPSFVISGSAITTSRRRRSCRPDLVSDPVSHYRLRNHSPTIRSSPKRLNPRKACSRCIRSKTSITMRFRNANSTKNSCG